MAILKWITISNHAGDNGDDNSICDLQALMYIMVTMMVMITIKLQQCQY